MKTTDNQLGSGFVQIAIWKENPKFSPLNDESFYDFSIPLDLLGAPGWNSAIRTLPDENGFFVLTTDVPPFSF